MTDEELDALFRAARAHSRDPSRVEHAFETRLLARIRAEHAQTSPLGRWSWRLAPGFLAVAVACGWWAASSSDAVLATAVIGTDEDWSIVEYLTGQHL